MLCNNIFYYRVGFHRNVFCFFKSRGKAIKYVRYYCVSSSQDYAYFDLRDFDATNKQKEILWKATNKSWTNSYKEYTEKMQPLVDANVSKDTYLEVKKELKAYTGENSAEEKRQALMNDKALSANQKAALDKTLISENSTVDYTNEDTFTISQMSDSARYKWTLAEPSGISAKEYEKYWKTYFNGGTPSKDVGIQRLLDAGISKNNAMWFYTKIVQDKSGSAGKETPERKKVILNTTGWNEETYAKYLKAYLFYGTKEQKVAALMAAGLSDNDARWFIQEMTR